MRATSQRLPHQQQGLCQRARLRAIAAATCVSIGRISACEQAELYFPQNSLLANAGSSPKDDAAVP
jgi:hypothetical protein